jgi:hypothetical protein
MIAWSLPPPLLFSPFLRLQSPHAEGVHRKLETCRHVKRGSTGSLGAGESHRQHIYYYTRSFM